jgi:heme/copper-type cytochrome/quinol oxidase subunit 2
MRKTLFLVGLAGLLAMGPATAQTDEYVLTIKDHRFTPTELKVPANKRVQITVVNDDPTAEEFESHELKVEKVIPGKSKAVVRVGPLKPGRYPFFGEFHEATAKGTLIAE